mmetsp:Transcript_29995/g.86306  ORF Transcript_29995/g.86306 Transcript_29995/m.86306 type:complete len:252 (-) Transcript_29995:1441-2196(-)
MTRPRDGRMPRPECRWVRGAGVFDEAGRWPPVAPQDSADLFEGILDAFCAADRRALSSDRRFLTPGSDGCQPRAAREVSGSFMKPSSPFAGASRRMCFQAVGKLSSLAPASLTSLRPGSTTTATCQGSLSWLRTKTRSPERNSFATSSSSSPPRDTRPWPRERSPTTMALLSGCDPTSAASTAAHFLAFEASRVTGGASPPASGRTKAQLMPGASSGAERGQMRSGEAQTTRPACHSASGDARTSTASPTS